MTLPDTHDSPAPHGRVVAAGKFLRAGSSKAPLRAVSYGPFRPGAETPERLEGDFASIRALGFNAVRVYELPSEPMLATASRHGLRLIVGIPWTQHIDFLRDPKIIAEIEARITDAAQRLGQHEAVAALLVGNEIEASIVRWMEPRRVKRFIERLVHLAKQAAPQCLVSYATYPSTEYLIADNADFLAVNVYLEQREAFEKYLLRLQHLAGNKPLVISEFGLDVAQHGEAQQAETRTWFEAACARHGVAGSVWFAFTDEWHRGGEDVTQWRFGLVDADRRPRLAGSLEALITSLPNTNRHECTPITEPDSSSGRSFVSIRAHSRSTDRITPIAPLPAQALIHDGPRISVVVCTRNGSATLRACLESLARQSYANHEVIVVDDGSTDAVPDIARSFAFVRYHRLNHGGLSVARNAGALMATGEVIAYTDDDCMADEDWLRHLAAAFDDPQWVAAGGPNIPPPARNRTEALVAAAPGGPAHVMLNDEEAEHLPGCNLAIRKSALDAIGGFDPIFRTAGDDVDVCWRLRDAGGRLRFVPAAMVWHHRRFTVKAYFKQQSGYGHAEALLMKQHPQRFGPIGGARWRGAIYGDTLEPSEGSIFHGPQGTGLFQVIYANGGCAWCHWLSGVLWIALAILFLALRLPWISAGVVAFVGWFAWRRMSRSGAAPRDLGGKLKLWALCLTQPVIRELARLDGMLNQGTRPSFRPHLPDILPPQRPRKYSWRIFDTALWSETGITREAWLKAFRDLLREQGIPFRDDDGWRWFDLELHPARWITQSIVTVTEYHGGSRVLTRIGVQCRVRWLLVPLVAAALLLALALPIDPGMKLLLFGIPLGLDILLSAIRVFASLWWLEREIQAAADRAGLNAFNPSCATSPERTRQQSPG